MPSSPGHFDIRGRVCLVTGASSGLGAHFARVLAANGAKVVLASRRVDRLERMADELGADDCLAVAADVSDEAAVRRLVATAADGFGRLDVLVNNAGVADGSPAEAEDLGSFEKVLRVNLAAAFLCAREAAGVMLPQGSGSIINIASIASLVSLSDRYTMAAYAASKSGLAGLTRELAGQWAARGIRVNAIAPGFFPSEMTDGLRDADQVHWIESRTPLGRPGRLEELDGPLLFLASDASSYVIGHTLVVDGGWTIW